MEQIQELYRKIAQLEKENNYLKRLLKSSNISYETLDKIVNDSQFDPNQGKRIVPREITDMDANRFFSMFWGRTDVYSKRTVNKKTGEVGYFPQCSNFMRNGCPRIFGSKIKCRDCTKRVFKKLQNYQITAHLKGLSENGSDVVGIFPLWADDTCRFIVFDFDNHDKGAGKHDFANEDEEWKAEVEALREICQINGIASLTERSRSGRGAHLWIFFKENIDASLAREFGNALLRKGSQSVNLKSFRYYDRMLPGQDHLPPDGLGNVIALPLQGMALKEGNSAFVDENWNAYPDQWKTLFNTSKLPQTFIESKINEWKLDSDSNEPNLFTLLNDGEKPWEKTQGFSNTDVEGVMQIILGDGIYIYTPNLKPRIQNRIRELAAFRNPIFYKNQIMGLSNFMNARYIYLGKDENDYIKIPRGLREKIIDECHKGKIDCEIQDKRCKGSNIRVEFNGQLKLVQAEAVEALMKYDTGILNAATAFGKTVVCCNIIAKKKVNTLILLQSTALMEQWQNALEKFLIINEEPPQYETPTKRIKKRKNVIGRLKGAHDSTTGIIDIAMVGSVCKKGVFHKRLKEYGLVIVDECHHAAYETMVEVLQEVKAKFVYGVTATPYRSDGLEKINKMLLGDIRYQYTAKERAEEQGIGHFVYPRFTKAVLPRFQQDKIHPNEAYAALRNNDERDRLIVEDVIQSVKLGRTPVVLSRYIDHSRKLYEYLNGHADKVFLLLGKSSRQEHKKILTQMNQVKKNESMILIATGK